MKRTSDKSRFLDYESKTEFFPGNPKKKPTVFGRPIKILQIEAVPYGQSNLRILIEYEFADENEGGEKQKLQGDVKESPETTKDIDKPEPTDKATEEKEKLSIKEQIETDKEKLNSDIFKLIRAYEEKTSFYVNSINITHQHSWNGVSTYGTSVDIQVN